MRVISGTARGKVLLPVPGMTTRPTTDRVKENIFNIIQTRVRGAKVLDLFAGTGQMGIEALSRGAASCDFVDHDREALCVIRKNIDGARVASRAHVHAARAAAFLERCRGAGYDLVFLDPPYGGKLLNEAVFAAERFDILSENGIMVCESAVADVLDPRISCGREYRYGAIRVTVLEQNGVNGIIKL